MSVLPIWLTDLPAMRPYGQQAVGLILAGISAFGCGGSKEPPQGPAPEYEIPTPPSPAPSMAPPEDTGSEPAASSEQATRSLEIALLPKSGSKLSGKASLAETPKGVRITIAVENVQPGDHGAHVHEIGDCSAPDATSAGSHFNPEKHPHALPQHPERHLGDLGNLQVGPDGTGKLELTVPGASLRAEDPKSFLGRAIIVHEKKDDGGQPVGNAGARIGCAVIQ